MQKVVKSLRISAVFGAGLPALRARLTVSVREGARSPPSSRQYGGCDDGVRGPSSSRLPYKGPCVENSLYHTQRYTVIKISIHVAAHRFSFINIRRTMHTTVSCYCRLIWSHHLNVARPGLCLPCAACTVAGRLVVATGSHHRCRGDKP